MLLENGTYNAVVKNASPYIRGNGRLSMAFNFDVGGKEIIGRSHIELNDGSISEKSLKTLRECFPDWDRSVASLFASERFVDTPLSIVIENEADPENPEKFYSNVKWINPVGKAVGAGMPAAASQSEIVAKYGARFRALSGGTPVQSPPREKTPTTQEPLGMNECWAALQQKMGDKPRKVIEKKWDAIIEKHAGGKDYDAITADEWSQIMAACSDNLSF